MFRLVRFFLLAILFVIVAFCLVNPGFYVLEKTNDVKPGTVDNNDVIVYFINMDKSKERLNHMLPYVQGLGLSFERIPGVDGNKLSDEEINEVLDTKMYAQYAMEQDSIPRGVVGCSLSHLKAWEAFINSRYKFALIFEDDVTFDPELLRKMISELTVKDPQKWDIATFLKNKTGSTVTMHDLFDGYVMNLDFMSLSGSNAYILNRKAAADFINYFYPIKIPLDGYFARPWEFGMKFVSIEPFIVHHASGLRSESSRTTRIQFAAETQNDLNGKIMRFKTKIARVVYNTKLLIANFVTS